MTSSDQSSQRIPNRKPQENPISSWPLAQLCTPLPSGSLNSPTQFWPPAAPNPPALPAALTQTMSFSTARSISDAIGPVPSPGPSNSDVWDRLTTVMPCDTNQSIAALRSARVNAVAR